MSALSERRIPEQTRRLGRHVKHDPRSKHFPAKTAPEIVSVAHASVGLPLNQGNIGSCTANALCGALNCAPNQKFRYGPFTEKGARNLYHLETVLEGQPWPPNDPGGSGLEVCQAARQMGWITGYSHAFSTSDALGALVLRPVITGINWYDSFDQPDPSGLVAISPNAQIRGGHEIVAYGIDAENKLVWFWNSWGPGWGLGGRFCMSWSTWDSLLGQQGDVTVPVQ